MLPGYLSAETAGRKAEDLLESTREVECVVETKFLFNPVVRSLRAIQQASELRKVQRKLGCQRASLGSLSEATDVFQPELLKEIISKPARLSKNRRCRGRSSGAFKVFITDSLWGHYPAPARNPPVLGRRSLVLKSVGRLSPSDSAQVERSLRTWLVFA